MISFCVILFTFLLEIPLLLASEIHCETDMDNPIPFGSDVSVTCESKVEELIGLSIKRPGPSKNYNVKMLPSSTRLKMINLAVDNILTGLQDKPMPTRLC